MKRLITQFCFILFISFISYSSQVQDAEKLSSVTQFNKGTDLLGKKQLGDALPLWLNLFLENPSNANISFKLGLCYYYTLDKQKKALPYFKIASRKITNEYDFYNGRETSAPLEALYYLAESYLTLMKPDSALRYFYEYKDQFVGEPTIEVDSKIRKCLNAINLVNNPLMVKYENFGDQINSGYPETNPVISFDNSFMFFSSRRLRKDRSNENVVDKSMGLYYEDIYYTEYKGFWSEPELFEYNTKGNDAPLCISADGTKLYLRQDDGSNVNIFVSTFKDGVWGRPESLGIKINSLFNETGATINADETMLIISSDRENGSGGADLYVCYKRGGNWTKPKNLGTNVNTSGNEINPYIYPNGKKLFFSSNGHAKVSMGGYDILYCDLNSDGTWSSPRNVGYPINTTADDMYYYVGSEGKRYCAAISDKLDYDLFEIVKGEFEAMNLKPGVNISASAELDIMDIVEIEREIEKEVEVKEIIEKEIIKETEVEVIKLLDDEGTILNPELVKAQAELAQAEAEKAKAEADKMKAEAQKALADAEKAKAEAEILKAEVEKMKVETEQRRIEVDSLMAQVERIKAESLIHQAEISKADAEKAKADAEKANADKVIAKENRKKAKYDVKMADVGKAQADAEKAEKEREKAVAEAEKAKAEATQSKAQSDQTLAEAEKAKAEAEKIKAEADLKMADIEKSKLEIEKLNTESANAKSNAEQAKADEAKANADAEKAKADAEKAKAETELIKADTEKAKAEAEKAKEETKKFEAEKEAKMAETEKYKAETAQAKADAEKAKAEAEASNAESKKLQDEANKLKAEAEKLKAEAEKLKAEAEKAKAEADAEKAKAEN